jgi:hypothetical protein
MVGSESGSVGAGRLRDSGVEGLWNRGNIEEGERKKRRRRRWRGLKKDLIWV